MKILIPLSLLLAASVARASFVDDRDLTGGRRGPVFRANEVSTTLTPDRVELGDDPALTIQVLREVRGRLTPVTGLQFTTGAIATFAPRTDRFGVVRLGAACAGTPATVTVTAPLADERQYVTDDDEITYRVVAQVPCRGLARLIFKADSAGGQAVGIWQVAHLGETKLAAEVGLGFWNRRLQFIWPGDGDYYTGATVTLTRGDYWDVVGHEMGHAIYDFGGLGVFGGGAHKIDECYSDALALSEGWASYYSAWLMVDLRDPDAKFEYMVPRRAPLRFENIPGDVCKGPRNEWRVTGYFWDLVDYNVDGENSQSPFKFVWDAMFRKNARSMDQVRTLLLQRGLNAQIQETIWTLNFLQ